MIEKGTQLGTVECPGCGGDVPLKVNKSGGVYYFCAAVLERDEEGKVKEKCFTRFTYGRTASCRMINEFLKQEKSEDVKELKNREEEPAGAGDSAGETLPQRDGGGTGTDVTGQNQRSIGAAFWGGVGNFLTGDE